MCLWALARGRIFADAASNHRECFITSFSTSRHVDVLLPREQKYATSATGVPPFTFSAANQPAFYSSHSQPPSRVCDSDSI